MNHPFKAWKVHPSDGKLSPWVYGEEPDQRTLAEKLNEAVADKLLAAEVMQKFRPTGKDRHDEICVGNLERRNECAESRLVSALEDMGVADIAALRDALALSAIGERKA